MKLVVENLKKYYNEDLILDNLNIELKEGHIYALLGKNGAGKTTFFECLNGSAEYTGNCFLEENNEKKGLNIGFLRDEIDLPDFLTGKEFLKFFLECNNYDVNKLEEYFNMIQFTPNDQNKFIKEYSLGMKNKLQLLLYLIIKPKVLLLDEPLSSFDIIAAKEMKEFLKQLKQDHIIIMSTHILELAQSVCDELLLLNHQKIEHLDKNLLKDQDFEKKIVELLES